MSRERKQIGSRQKPRRGSGPSAECNRFDEEKQTANQSQINTGEECR